MLFNACTLISCCSIVKDLPNLSVRLSRVLRDPIIISHSFQFVKRFLKSFLKNFFGIFHPLFFRLPHLAEVLDYYTTSSILCQGVSQKFFQLFCSFFNPRASRLSQPFAALQLCGIFVFLRNRGSPRIEGPSTSLSRSFAVPAHGQLAYYSTSASFCQALLLNFFRFGGLSHSVVVLSLFSCADCQMLSFLCRLVGLSECVFRVEKRCHPCGQHRFHH